MNAADHTNGNKFDTGGLSPREFAGRLASPMLVTLTPQQAVHEALQTGVPTPVTAWYTRGGQQRSFPVVLQRTPDGGLACESPEAHPGVQLLSVIVGQFTLPQFDVISQTFRTAKPISPVEPAPRGHTSWSFQLSAASDETSYSDDWDGRRRKGTVDWKEGRVVRVTVPLRNPAGELWCVVEMGWRDSSGTSQRTTKVLRLLERRENEWTGKITLHKPPVSFDGEVTLTVRPATVSDLHEFDFEHHDTVSQVTRLLAKQTFCNRLFRRHGSQSVTGPLSEEFTDPAATICFGAMPTADVPQADSPFLPGEEALRQYRESAANGTPDMHLFWEGWAEIAPQLLDIAERDTKGDFHWAQDIVDKTYEKAITKLPTTAYAESLRAWCFRVAKREFLQELRRRKAEAKRLQKFAETNPRFDWADHDVEQRDAPRELTSEQRQRLSPLEAAYYDRKAAGTVSDKVIAAELGVCFDPTLRDVKVRVERKLLADEALSDLGDRLTEAEREFLECHEFDASIAEIPFGESRVAANCQKVTANQTTGLNAHRLVNKLNAAMAARLLFHKRIFDELDFERVRRWLCDSVEECRSPSSSLEKSLPDLLRKLHGQILILLDAPRHGKLGRFGRLWVMSVVVLDKSLTTTRNALRQYPSFHTETYRGDCRALEQKVKRVWETTTTHAAREMAPWAWTDDVAAGVARQ